MHAPFVGYVFFTSPDRQTASRLKHVLTWSCHSRPRPLSGVHPRKKTLYSLANVRKWSHACMILISGISILNAYFWAPDTKRTDRCVEFTQVACCPACRLPTCPSPRSDDHSSPVSPFVDTCTDVFTPPRLVRAPPLSTIPPLL